jgi:hypothetical protein
MKMSERQDSGLSVGRQHAEFGTITSKVLGSDNLETPSLRFYLIPHFLFEL